MTGFNQIVPIEDWPIDTI